MHFSQRKVVAFDGKTVKGSQDRVNGHNAIHCLNAFLTEHHTFIRQIKVCMNLLRSAKDDKKTLKSTTRKALMFSEFALDLIRKSGFLEIGSLA